MPPLMNLKSLRQYPPKIISRFLQISEQAPEAHMGISPLWIYFGNLQEAIFPEIMY